MVKALGLGVTLWSPLGGGLLSGKQRRGEEGRHTRGGGSVRKESERERVILDAVQSIAAEVGASPAQVAIAWVRAQALTASTSLVPILGARTLEQLHDILGALALDLSQEHFDKLNAASTIELGFPHSMINSDRTRMEQVSGHSLIRAPITEVVGDRQAEVGEHVQPGTRILRVVPNSDLYVIANFKETQVARMRPGQAATIYLDALPGVTLRGKVDSLAPGSGSDFALLPFEPGTGNFTKIVQRVPVRIRLDAGQAAAARLRPGFSSEVEVSLR